MKGVLLIAMMAVVASAWPVNDNEFVEHPWASSHQRLTMVTRAQWGARTPTGATRLNTPVPNVIIHHTATGSCTSRNACSAIMRSMQNHHMNTNKWADIGYNFAVGGDGAVYEGRGWNAVGAHAVGWNSNSIGIAFIGTFSNASPPANQLNAARALITAGMNNGVIARNHRLMGHRQVSATECPGDALFRIIQTWPNWREGEVDFETNSK